MIDLDGDCSYLQTTRRGGGGIDATSVQCLFSISPLNEKEEEVEECNVGRTLAVDSPPTLPGRPPATTGPHAAWTSPSASPRSITLSAPAAASRPCLSRSRAALHQGLILVHIPAYL